MPLFDSPFSMEIPVQIGRIHTVFFVNNNLFVNNSECTSSPHCHHDFEIRYLSSGVCNQIINGQDYPLQSGELLLIHPWEYHHQNSNTDSTQFNLRFSVIQPKSADSAKQLAYESCISTLMKSRNIRDSSGRLRLYLEQLTDEIYCQKDGFNGIIRSLCVIIFIELMRISGAQLNRLFPPTDYQYRGLNRMRVEEFFTKKYLTEIKISDLAADMNASERQVNRYLHAMFGMPFTKKLNDIRLEKAASLLSETELTVSQIIQKCGFHNDKYFYQCFKSKFGMSPKQYRINSNRS